MTGARSAGLETLADAEFPPPIARLDHREVVVYAPVIHRNSPLGGAAEINPQEGGRFRFGLGQFRVIPAAISTAAVERSTPRGTGPISAKPGGKATPWNVGVGRAA